MANGPVFLGFSGLYVSMRDSVGHFYQTRDEWRDVLIPFLKAGLEAGDQCIYLLAPDSHWQELRMALIHARIDVEGVLASGQFICDVAQATPGALRGGVLRTLMAFSGRYRCLRWSGDIAWMLRQFSIKDWRGELDACSDLMKELPVVGLCQYDLTQLPGTRCSSFLLLTFWGSCVERPSSG
jgi:hypothetical protein